jgi:hypothetical protein
MKHHIESALLLVSIVASGIVSIFIMGGIVLAVETFTK